MICCECLCTDGLILVECRMLVKNRLECNTASCCGMWKASNKCPLDMLKINRHKYLDYIMANSTWYQYLLQWSCEVV